MRPEVGQYLLQTAQRLDGDLAASQNNDYDAATLKIFALLNMISAVEHDRGADLRVWENETMRQLFADAAQIILDPNLADRLLDAGAGTDKSLRISDLNEAGDALRALLIDLQVSLEQATDPSLVELHGDTWAFLTEATKRRALPLMPM
jgi:hypothetical protein